MPNITSGHVKPRRTRSVSGRWRLPVRSEDEAQTVIETASGTRRAVRAQPDGFTLNLGTLGANVLNGAAYSLSYDLLKDFEPIVLSSANPYVPITRKTVPANTLIELIAWRKGNQDHVSLGVSSMNQRVVGALFDKLTNMRLRFLPYRGAGPALQDLIAGQIDLLFDQPTNSMPQIRGGTINVFAVAASTRLSTAAEIPTADEAGLPGLYMLNWNAIFAAKKYAKDNRRGVEQSGCRRIARSRGSSPVRRTRYRYPAARSTDAKSSRQPAKSGYPKMVAYREGGEHKRRTIAKSGLRTTAMAPGIDAPGLLLAFADGVIE
jgi:hypothetical protein